MINKSLLISALFFLSACSSTNVPRITQPSSATWISLDENPEKTITGITDLYITDNGILNIEVSKYELLNEVMTGFKDGVKIVNPESTGNREWRSRIDLTEHKFRITGLGKTFETSINKIDISKKLSKPLDNDFIRVTCLTCSPRSEIDSYPQLYRLQAEPQMYQTNGQLAEEILKKNRQQKIEMARDVEQQKIKKDEIAANLNNISEDEKICRNYGFKPGTNAYGECRQKLDFAKQEAAQRQRDYEEQKRQYDAALQDRKNRALGAALMSIGQGLTGQNNRSNLTPQPPPQPSSQMITMPDGRRVTCTTMGSSTQCF